MELSDINRGEDVQLVMVTDVHMGTIDDSRGQLLLNLIESLGQWKLQNFLLCGDIFDFCQGTNPYFQKKFHALGEALKTLASGGTRVIFVEGNHEFDLQGLSWHGIEFLTEIDRVIEFSNGSRLAITHGDQIYNNLRYRKFRAVVKSRLVRWIARWVVPSKLMDWYTSRHSKLSRAADKYRNLDHASLISAMKQWLATKNAEHGVFGHFHVPYFEQRDAGSGFIVSCESWDAPNALVLYKDKFSRLKWDRHIQKWVRQPAVSFETS